MAMRGQLEGSVLYLEIVQWQPALDEALHPWRMLIAVDARLIDVATGRVVWTAHLPLRPVPTPGTVTRADADMIAAKRVAKKLFASRYAWRCGDPPGCVAGWAAQPLLRSRAPAFLDGDQGETVS